jgi:hypothetical protein
VSRLPDPEEEPVPEPPEPQGRVGSTGPAPLVLLGLSGLVLGWVLRPVAVEVSGAAPTVSWLPVLALFLVAAILGAVAWSTYRTLQVRGLRLPAHQAVNRLVLAKACALAGAFVAGGYLGYALSWVGVSEGDLAQQRMVRSVFAGAAGLLIMVGSLTLERACRVRRSDD